MMFERVICGVDGSPESVEALRQALRLRADGGSLLVVTVRHLASAVHAGHAAPQAARLIEEEAKAAQELARRVVADEPGVELRLLDGRPLHVLLSLVRAEDPSLVAVGAPIGGRAEGIAIGDVTTALAHEAPRGLLVARGAWDGPPRTVVVGHDGSPDAARALEAAHELRDRFGATVRVLAGTRGTSLAEDLAESVPGIELEDRTPTELLVDASRDADLVVVGTRGLVGLRALGSVSERLVHRAACSVLVVRAPAG